MGVFDLWVLVRRVFGRRRWGRKSVVRAWLMARCACAQVLIGW